MTGHIYFRDNFNKSTSGIFNHFPYLLLGVKQSSAVFGIVAGFHMLFISPQRQGGTFADASLLGQQWIAFDLNPPSLIVRQMPMKNIHLQQRHDIQDLLDLLHAPEMPGAVQHKPTMAESGLVFYFYRLEPVLPRAKLQQCHHPVKRAGSI